MLKFIILSFLILRDLNNIALSSYTSFLRNMSHICINLPEVAFRRPENGYFSLWLTPYTISKEKKMFSDSEVVECAQFRNARILEDVLFQDHFLLG
jgi:hypothetical protein